MIQSRLFISNIILISIFLQAFGEEPDVLDRNNNKNLRRRRKGRLVVQKQDNVIYRKRKVVQDQKQKKKAKPDKGDDKGGKSGKDDKEIQKPKTDKGGNKNNDKGDKKGKNASPTTTSKAPSSPPAVASTAPVLNFVFSMDYGDRDLVFETFLKDEDTKGSNHDDLSKMTNIVVNSKDDDDFNVWTQ